MLILVKSAGRGANTFLWLQMDFNLGNDYLYLCSNGERVHIGAFQFKHIIFKALS